ncbi:23S rRNA (cytosine(2499)-C(5))-methyltransferase [Deinococcus maricopensis]|uniref:rRNA (Guanine-N(2)-)-methyltransferase n=1 Tax=Deinococcus maricopensis (strain DSM 21211 / LMG 22137 / NRRL B-23946 / LB-34) TaxID=709986 RepID=E8U538_DEIML|nr:23S rRNA (cytosine(2499)-C(5))-methyltransferase [Deinococcus maricopensis]ADV66177.1 rRNA (guanine-N(2)-)-methyltransferase [Deinococcus maricopensis DSM 21211]
MPEQISPSLPRLRLRVTQAAASRLRGGHPWLYADSILHQNREGASGDLAVIYDRNDKFLAIGLFDPNSPLRLRVLHAGKPQTIDDAWWRARLDETLARRAHLFDERTNGYRLINGESDGWPGVVLDRYADTLVLKVYTSAWFPHWASVLGALVERFPEERLVLRLSRNIQKVAAKQYGLHDGQVLRGPTPDGPVVFAENGVYFEADVLQGQKTGFFLDQRDNRRRVEGLARGRRVLNAFSFSGGFSLYAARGGATSVVSLDISRHALASAERNFALNADDPNIRASEHHPVQADVFEWLKDAPARSFDLIILDPPSLAKRESERAGAVRAYARLVSDALRLLDRGGVLVAASCSAHVSADEFFGAVRDAVRASKRDFRELRTALHAPDHHATFPEAQYLKAIYLSVP